MEKKTENFGGMDMQKAMQLAQTDAAKQLLAMLQAQSGQQLQDAMTQAAAGNLGQAKDILQQLLQNDQAKQLLQQLQEE